MKKQQLKTNRPVNENIYPEIWIPQCKKRIAKYRKIQKNRKHKIQNKKHILKFGPTIQKMYCPIQKKEKEKKHAYKTNIYPEIWNPQNKGRIAQYRKIQKNIKLKIKNISWKLDPQYKNIYCPKQKNKKHEKITNI